MDNRAHKFHGNEVRLLHVQCAVNKFQPMKQNPSKCLMFQAAAGEIGIDFATR